MHLWHAHNECASSDIAGNDRVNKRHLEINTSSQGTNNIRQEDQDKICKIEIKGEPADIQDNIVPQRGCDVSIKMEQLTKEEGEEEEVPNISVKDEPI